MAAGDDPSWLRIEVPRALAGTRFDRVLAKLVPGRSGAQLQKLVRRGGVKVDGKKVVRSNFAVRGGESITLRLSEPAEPAVELDYLHVDEDVAVVAKPAGMMTHPTERYRGGSVSELAVQRFGPLPSISGPEERWGIVHRLDRETSGVLVLARTPEALDRLRNQFRARTVDKVYLALVYGAPDEESFDVELALGPAPGQRDLQRVDPAGRASFTSFRVLGRGERLALVECRPRTGRRHQIRVHLWAKGHPIVGDKLYRPQGGVERIRGLPHHALHAERLAFDHPRTGERLELRAPLPDGLQRYADRLV
ncbi:MAG: RluA family pseudouridine synthase [Planctomycetota bacterium]